MNRKGDKALIVGLDIGTTSTIGILIDDRGGTLATATRPSKTRASSAPSRRSPTSSETASTTSPTRPMMRKGVIEGSRVRWSSGRDPRGATLGHVGRGPGLAS